jgi:predicted ATP-grasp superfamily ATP-dependent carboligase
MSTQECALVRLTLFKHSAKSFLAALDEAGIPHGPVRMFSSAPQNSGLVEAITALSDAMPWNAIAKVVVAWIEARKSREVIICTEAGESFHAKGYSASEVQKLLQISTNVTVIDTKPVDGQ